MGRERYLFSLQHAVRIKVVLKYSGQLCLVLCVLVGITLAVSIVLGDYGGGLRYALVAAALALFGALTSRLRAPAAIQANEALAVTALIFIAAPLVMTYPMMAPGIPFTDAFFEAVSAVTTTGLSTLPTVEDKPPVFLFSRAWMQWSGGLGIVILTVALLIRPGVAARRLAFTEGEAEDLVGSTRAYARRVLWIYMAITAVGVLALLSLGVDSFTSLVHALAAVSTGGFSTFDKSISALGGLPAQAAVTAISLAGAVSLGLYYRARRRGLRDFLSDAEVQALVAVSVLSSGVLILIAVYSGDYGWGRALGEMPLMALSAQTTAGFSSTDVSELGQSSKLVLVLSMAVGGTVGSTAGGIKLLRILIVMKLFKLTVLRTCLPSHAVVELRLEGHRLDDEEIQRALLVVILFMALMVVSWVPFVLMGHDPLDSLFEVVSAAGTVGLSTGMTGPSLEPFLKGVLCADMLAGRLEILALLVLLYPGTWLGRRIDAR